MTRARLLGVALGTLLSVSQTHSQTPPATLPAYRGRVLGVFNATTGESIEGVEVVDLLAHTSALTSKTGTVSLAFLPDDGSMVRIQKIGFRPVTMIVAISAADTIPITVLLNPIAQTLPTVVTKDSSPRYISPGLSAFDERMKSHAGGRFITAAELRKSDNRKMTDVMRSAGVGVKCSNFPMSCFAVSTRAGCPFTVYFDGIQVRDQWRDLEQMQVAQVGGVEIYFGPSTIPPRYNMTGSACGVILMWTRERD
jgi:hypothetical protein